MSGIQINLPRHAKRQENMTLSEKKNIWNRHRIDRDDRIKWTRTRLPQATANKAALRGHVQVFVGGSPLEPLHSWHQSQSWGLHPQLVTQPRLHLLTPPLWASVFQPVNLGGGAPTFRPEQGDLGAWLAGDRENRESSQNLSVTRKWLGCAEDLMGIYLFWNPLNLHVKSVVFVH